MTDVAHDGGLAALAHACGVATQYADANGQARVVPAETVRAVLAAMGHDVEGADPGQLAAELEDARWRRMVAPTIVLRRSEPFTAALFLPEGSPLRARVELEDGTVRTVPTDDMTGSGGGRRLVDGRTLTAVEVPLPQDLPLGYHRLVVDNGLETAESALIIAPQRAPFPKVPPAWGWMLQLYALRSANSWGFGDLGDLAELARWSGADLGADFLLVNPLHAAAPVVPVEPSPYYPSTRRFTSPLYIRIEDVPEFSTLDEADRERVRSISRAPRSDNRGDRIDRDAVLAAKYAALEVLYDARSSDERTDAYTRYRDAEGAGLRDFATFCVIAEQYGVPFQQWPAHLRHPGNEAVARVRDEAAARVDFHMWLQFLCDEQLADAQRTASDAGMGIGVIHDLAVGVDRGGADAWALQDHLAMTMSVGAPPDPFNQQGQNWQQPPLLPGALEASGFRPLRDMLRSVLRHSGGIRIDHILGLFRLYWIPQDAQASAGTYVRYPAEAMLGVLVLEAHRAGAIVVGEDLGTVAQGVHDAMRDTGILSSAVLYFEQDEHGRPRSQADYPRPVLASVNTHDLPTAAGWLTDAAIRTQIALGLLAEATDPDEEMATRAAFREAVEERLRASGLLAAEATLDDRIDALYGFLGGTPSLLVAAALSDAVGDLRQPNMPGTTDEYPNWRLPLSEPDDGAHRPVLLEDVRKHALAHRLANTLQNARGGRPT